MMNNPVKPIPCEIIDIKKESLLEYTFKVKTDIQPDHGQFLQLSIPKIGEAPISVSAHGEGWMDFTIRSVGKVTDEIFNKQLEILYSYVDLMDMDGQLKMNLKVNI